MTRALKIIVWIAVAALGLSVVCIVLLVRFFNPNDYKAQIEQWVEQQTGRNFTLDGDLQWRVWPSVALTLPPARLAASPNWLKQGATDGDFAEWQRASLSVRVWPLLQRRLEFGVLSLRGLRLRLQRDAQGDANWQDLLQLLTAEDQPSRWQFERLAGVELEDVDLQFDDQLGARRSRLQLSFLQSDAVRYAQPITLRLQGVLHTETPADSLELPFKLQVLGQTDAALQQVQLHNLQGSAEVSGMGLSGAIAMQHLPLSIEVADLTWWAAGQLQAKSLVLRAADAQLAGEFDITQLNATPQLGASMQVSLPQLRTWLQALSIVVPATRDATALQSLQASLRVTGTAQNLQLQLPLLQLDQTRFTGEGSWQLHDSEPRYAFNLHADQLNLDRYLPAGSAKAKSTISAAGATTPLPVAWLRSLHAQGQLQIDQAQLQGIRARNLTLDLDEG
ncbi:MAG: AsmA family protein [Steroidobacteraceae bacterium]